MNASYKARLWHARKEQRELEVAVKEARRRWTLIDRARIESPRRTEEFALLVKGLSPRIATMMTRLESAGKAQNEYLANIAIRELEAQKERLAAYGLQAQFALATIYDRASGAGNTTTPSTESPSGTPDTSSPAPDTGPTPPSVTPSPTTTEPVPTASNNVAPARFAEIVNGRQP
jgi:hypothetical protein